MAKEKFEKALADWPYTKQLKDGGMHVFGKYEQPGLAQRMLNFWLLFCFVLFFWIIFATENGVAAIVGTAIAGFAYPMMIRPMMVNMMGKNVDVKVFKNKIQVRSGMLYRNYDRDMPIEFRAEDHQKGLEEHAKEIKFNKRQPRTYREALEVVMQYGEKRIPLAEFPMTAVEQARALVIRMQNVCRSIDAIHKMARDQAGAAGDEPVSDFGPTKTIR
jgi:hypothetical protein